MILDDDEEKNQNVIDKEEFYCAGLRKLIIDSIPTERL